MYVVAGAPFSRLSFSMVGTALTPVDHTHRPKCSGVPSFGPEGGMAHTHMNMLNDDGRTRCRGLCLSSNDRTVHVGVPWGHADGP
jgi:hypothetical protein